MVSSRANHNDSEESFLCVIESATFFELVVICSKGNFAMTREAYVLDEAAPGEVLGGDKTDAEDSQFMALV